MNSASILDRLSRGNRPDPRSPEDIAHIQERERLHYDYIKALTSEQMVERSEKIANAHLVNGQRLLADTDSEDGAMVFYHTSCAAFKEAILNPRIPVPELNARISAGAIGQALAVATDIGYQMGLKAAAKK